MSYEQAKKKCAKEGFKGGVPWRPRTFFCTEVAAKSDDAAMAMRPMRHTSLATTTKYMRTAGFGLQMSDLAKLEKMRELAKMLENDGFLKGNLSGGGRSRTADAADMSRVL